MASQVPVIPLFQEFGVLVRKAGLRGLAPSDSQFSYFWNVEDWRWAR